ncbi:hypothetical protein HDE_09202 [Halotydeus destructor]|nr:hypothetical protein HDE_09202 [Halotydeus destructor]
MSKLTLLLTLSVLLLADLDRAKAGYFSFLSSFKHMVTQFHAIDTIYTHVAPKVKRDMATMQARSEVNMQCGNAARDEYYDCMNAADDADARSSCHDDYHEDLSKCHGGMKSSGKNM